LLVCNSFEGDLGELVFQHNFPSFMKSENWKKKKKGKKYIYIRSLKMCFLSFWSKYFTWDQWFVCSGNFCKFLTWKIWFWHMQRIVWTYVEMAQIRQNLII
jgi:hypothetical protein